MKILALNINQKVANRGLETFLFSLQKEMKKKEVDFDIFSEDLISFSSFKNTFLSKILHKFYLDKYSLQVFLFTLKKIKNIKNICPEIIIPANGGWQAVIIRFFRMFFKYKIIIVGEAGIGFDDWFNLKFGKPDVFVALTREQEIWAKKINPEVRVVKIPNGVDLKKFNVNGEKIELNLEKPIFLCVAAFDSYKNIDKTILTVSKLPKGSLVILGQGSESENIKKMCDKYLSGRYLISKSSYDDLPKWYRSAQVFTLVSGFQEAFGNVYVEAMASGLPCVATNDDKRHEIIGGAGLFVNPNDIEEYKTALMKAVVLNWGEKPLRQAQKFSWEIIGKIYYEEFKKLL